jgi:alkaline phosphatase D
MNALLSFIRVIAISLFVLPLELPLEAAEFRSDWQGSRPWVGPEYWAGPLYDWKTVDGAVVAVAAQDRLLHLLSHRPLEPQKGFQIRVSVELLYEGSISSPNAVWAGIAVGVKGMMDDPRHVAVWPKQRIVAVVRADGRLALGEGAISEDVLAGDGPVELELTASDGELRLTGTRNGKSASVSMAVKDVDLMGNLCLAASSPRKPGDKRGEIRARFRDWRVSGAGIGPTGVEPFGPILWTQYTRQGNNVKVSAQMAPMGESDAQEVTLDIKQNNEWREVGTGVVDPLARNALIRAEIPDGVVEYRVRYSWQGRDSHWSGTFAEDPGKSGKPLKIALFSCDNGYAFPLPTMVGNVTAQNPDLLFFAGDQIYESYGGYGLVRTPTEKAMLDYLRKYYQFGWTWRSLLKDKPSIILPDDHDVFQGNLWGNGGRATKFQDSGGYMMPVEWVNAVERTQTVHLPDAVDPAPLESGIGVYFTSMTWGGVPMAVIEDRKWKSGPGSLLPKGTINANTTADKLDPPAASLLGQRQERFLGEWAVATREEPMRLVFSQTIFCKGHTHAGAELKKNRFDLDSNGWPRSGRQRALQPLKGNRTLMLHGDQHLGLLVRQGIDDWNDGPWAFMVPGTANGFPRAWWPEDGRITGDFTDPFGNKFTVLAAANPEKGSNTLKPREMDQPEFVAQNKGSGHGIVIIAPDRKSAVIEMWRYQFDTSNPKPGDQFNGFPKMIRFGE